jgi:hypothetical protein
MRKPGFYIFGIVLVIGCLRNDELPQEKYYPFDYTANYSYKNDTLKVVLKNPLNCPLRISISSRDKSLLDIVVKFGTLTLKEKTDTI